MPMSSGPDHPYPTAYINMEVGCKTGMALAHSEEVVRDELKTPELADL